MVHVLIVWFHLVLTIAPTQPVDFHIKTAFPTKSACETALESIMISAQGPDGDAQVEAACIPDPKTFSVEAQDGKAGG